MRRDFSLIIYATALAWLAAGYWITHLAHAQDVCTIGHEHEEGEEEDSAIRDAAAQLVEWRGAPLAMVSGSSGGSVSVQLLAINDFHGQRSTGCWAAGR